MSHVEDMLYTINRKYLIVIDLLELSYRNAIFIDIKHRLSTQVLEHIYFLYKRTSSVSFSFPNGVAMFDHME